MLIKKTVRPYTETMHILIVLTGFLISLAIVGYRFANYTQTLADSIQHSLPSGDSILQWLIAI